MTYLPNDLGTIPLTRSQNDPGLEIEPSNFQHETLLRIRACIKPHVKYDIYRAGYVL